MELTTRHIEDVTLIHLGGRIDHKTAKDFEGALKPHLDECVLGESRKILVDMAGVDFMTSAGLRVLMIGARICAKHTGEIAVAALQPMIQEIFRISRFDLVLKVFPTVQSALEQMSPVAAAAYRNR
jgi:anti-anti-sigma factor